MTLAGRRVWLSLALDPGEPGARAVLACFAGELVREVAIADVVVVAAQSEPCHWSLHAAWAQRSPQ